MASCLPKYKRDIIRKDFLGDRLPSAELAKKLAIDKSTLIKYRNCFRIIQRDYPDRINDFDFMLKMSTTLKARQPEIDSYTQLINVLPELIDRQTYRSGLKLRVIFAQYRELCPKGYKFQNFFENMNKWRKEKNICYYHHLRIKGITPDDLVTLTGWRKSATETRKWKQAVVIVGSYNGRHIKDLIAQVEIKLETLLKWFEDYQTGGIIALERKPLTLNEAISKAIKTKQENIVKLLHQSPRIHGINRASWRLTDLALVYKSVYGEFISPTCISNNLIKSDYEFRKSKEVLTSPDPKFREKLDHIQNILRNLKPNESFFSIDEYGHFSVKLKGGKSIVKKGELVSVPQLQKSKGFLIVTAALELSTNQVTHFYSRKKDTEEMIKLIDILLEQYKGQKTLYLSWDAAGWHSSTVLKARINELNSDKHTAIHHNPVVKLAPLPSSAQFLNVIESVFSGLARAVIHNSDYVSLEECQLAITQHFNERNEHFRANPKQAGNKIWGKEIVKSVFDEANHCQGKK